jgi:hypothetical protein
LDVNTYEEIEHDENATSQAAIIVAIVALLNAIGSGIVASMTEGSFITSFLLILVWTFIGWGIWAGVTYFIGTTFFGGRATMGEMLRVLGFAQVPQVLGIIPCVGIIGAIWALVTGFIAVRQGLDLDNTKAAITVVIGWLIVFVGSLLIGGATALVGGALG